MTTNILLFFINACGFFPYCSEKPDLYGPFWITTSLVFTVAVTSHMSSWLQSWLTGINWQYDLQSMVNAASVIYGYAGLAPVAAYFGLGQIGVDIKLLSLICLYGYSLGVFIAASLVCLMPSQMAIWIALLVAAGVSAVFLMRNLAPLVMQVSPANVQSASIAIAIVQLVFIIFLKRAIF
jgi:hypothetical protein